MLKKEQKKSKVTVSNRNKVTDVVKAKGDDLMNLQEIYENLLKDCDIIIVELWKKAQVLTIKMNFLLGEAISQGKEYIKITDLIDRLSRDLKMSERKLWYSFKFFEKFKTWENVEKMIDSNTKWTDIIIEHLTESIPSITKKKKIDGGHIKLVDDVKDIFDRVKAFQYNDEYSEYAFPKKTLVDDLNELIKNTKRGDYDN